MSEEDNRMNIGLLGELQVEQRLVEQGWHPVRLDTAQMASNADLLAVDRKTRIAIQVKTTDSTKQALNAQWLGFGYSTNHLRHGATFFNAKKSPLIADVVVAVGWRGRESRFIVLPVALAEALCAFHAKFWFSTPTTKGGTRGDTFPIYLCFTATRKTYSDHYERIKRNVLAFEDRWEILNESIDKLHDPKAWKLLR